MASLPSRANQSAKVGCLSLEVDRVEKRGTLARAVAVPICRENVNNRASLQATHARSHTDCTRTHCDLAHTPAFPPPQQTERSPHLVPVPDFPSSQCASPSSLERIRTYQLLRTTPPPPPSLSSSLPKLPNLKPRTLPVAFLSLQTSSLSPIFSLVFLHSSPRPPFLVPSLSHLLYSP